MSSCDMLTLQNFGACKLAHHSNSLVKSFEESEKRERNPEIMHSLQTKVGGRRTSVNTPIVVQFLVMSDLSIEGPGVYGGYSLSSL